MISLRYAVAILALSMASSLVKADTERAALEARIEALQDEMEMLQQQLEQHQAAEPLNDLERRGASLDDDLEREVATRRQLERESSRNPFSITTHRLNYLLPLSYTDNTNDVTFSDIDTRNSPNDTELKFQLSAKFNLLEDIFGNNGDLYFAYTQRSWWQAYNADASSPFRETNYEPEFLLDFDNHWSFLGWTNIHNRIALNHQSNGRSAPLSRSWNRLILESVFVNDDWAFSVAPHWRIPESDSEDDNPDIERYMGYGDVTVAHRIGDDQELSLMVRGNPSAGNMGGQIDYSWPMFGNVRGHLQYYHGYGESMIDYNHRHNRLSLGFSFNPLFTAAGLGR